MSRYLRAHNLSSSENRAIDYKTALMEVVEWQRQKLLSKNNLSEDGLLFDPWSFSGVRTRVDLRPEQAIDIEQMQSRDFNEGPGEMDMLIGFFFMNGACIVFFLMFGMCVICSCMRRKPALFRQKDKTKKSPPVTTSSSSNSKSSQSVKPITLNATNSKIPQKVITSPAIKANFKSLVSKAMKNPEFYKMGSEPPKDSEEGKENRKMSTTSKKDRKSSVASIHEANPAVKLLRKCSDTFKECHIQIEEPDTPQLGHSASYPVKIHVECTDASIQPLLQHSPTYSMCNQNHKGVHPDIDLEKAYNRSAPKASPDPVEDPGETVSLDAVLNEPPSIVRQNLLGPLTFDDLYYT